MTRLVCITLVLTAGSALAQTREPPVIYLPPIVPPGLKLLTQPAVQADIGLTAGQKADVESLHHLWGLPPRKWEVAFVTPEMARAVIAQQTQEFLTKTLTKEQRTRLDQIVFQLWEKEFGAHAAFAMAARDLGLRADQVEDVQNLKGLRVEEIVKHVASGERYEKIRDKVAATNGETFEKMAEMLSRAQRERLKELRGKPFAAAQKVGDAKDAAKKAGEAKLGEAEETAGKASRMKFVYPPELFGVYDYEIRYLGSLFAAGELEIRLGQVESAAKAIKAWDSEYERQGLSLKTVGALHDQTAKALAEILTDKQRKKFDAIMAGRRRAIGGYEAACGYPPVVASLRLTPFQLNQLKEGKTVGEVLTKAQAEALDDLVGEPTKLATWVVDPLRDLAEKKQQPRKEQENATQPAFARSFLVLSGRLRLSEDQIKKLRDLAEDEPKVKDLIRRELSLAETPPFAGSTRSLTVDRAVMDKYQAAVEEQCWSVLDAQQQSLARKIFGRGGR